MERVLPMITHDQIVQKVRRLYAKAVTSLLAGDTEFFPYQLTVDREPSRSISEAIREVAELRQNSKDATGVGYQIEWKTRRSRSLGLNEFPEKIWLPSMEDLVGLVDKKREWKRLSQAVCDVRIRLPQLHDWIPGNWRRLLEVESRLDGLIAVVEYLQRNPRPDCFLRELPLAVPTKLVQQNASLLSEWLDTCLPPSAIDFGVDRKWFAKRYGLREVTEHLRVRWLDPTLSRELGLCFEELSLPARSLDALPVTECHVWIVENKVNWLTLPYQHRGVAFGGLGRGVTQLFTVGWLERMPIRYWGDIDVEGFEILAMVRQRWPQVRSQWMDLATIKRFESLGTVGQGRTPTIPEELTDDERAAMAYCIERNLRIEQEHLPLSAL